MTWGEGAITRVKAMPKEDIELLKNLRS